MCLVVVLVSGLVVLRQLSSFIRCRDICLFICSCFALSALDLIVSISAFTVFDILKHSFTEFLISVFGGMYAVHKVRHSVFRLCVCLSRDRTLFSSHRSSLHLFLCDWSW